MTTNLKASESDDYSIWWFSVKRSGHLWWVYTVFLKVNHGTIFRNNKRNWQKWKWMLINFNQIARYTLKMFTKFTLSLTYLKCWET